MAYVAIGAVCLVIGVILGISTERWVQNIRSEKPPKKHNPLRKV